MTRGRGRVLGATMFALLFWGCALRVNTPVAGSEAVDLVWRGEVLLDHSLVLPRGSTLTLEPGTVVRFGFRDDDGDGLGDVSLRVEGELRARGTSDQPVVFTSSAPRAEPGQWGEIRVDFGAIDLRYTVIEGSTRGLHAHFSHGQVSDSLFRRNVDGTRLGESRLTLEHCLFAEQSGKGFNARHSRVVLRKNWFRANRFGVFLFEGDDASTFEQNVFRGNESAFFLGDFFEGIVLARDSDWGPLLPASSPEAAPSARLEATRGRVSDAGPRHWPFWAPAWTTELGGFVDAGPTLADEGVYAASWSGRVARLGLLDGAVLAGTKLPDVVDAAPALGPGWVALPCWDRAVRLLGRGDLAPRGEAAAAETSAADDHRQSGAAAAGAALYTASWSGTVEAFDTAGGGLRRRWSFRADGPFRADLTVAGGVVLAPCQSGTLYALDAATGAVRWRYWAKAPLLSGAAEDGRRVFLADREGSVHALTLASGIPLWTARLGGAVWYAPPLLADGGLFQGDDSGTLTRLDPETGRVVWSHRSAGGIRSRPVQPAAGTVAVGTGEGHFLLLDENTGFERDGYRAGGPVFSPAAVAGNRVVFGSRDGFVHALDVGWNDVDGHKAAR